ncbi:TPA: ADP-ribosylglycohydrolase family protein [Streptococcus suis]|nr:ADP-ribosylglycohydrolase family protein [Streptococcus suis]
MNSYQLKSMIYGIACGDALGVPFEFCERGSYQVTDMVGYGTYYQPKGTWSDDTSMTLATLVSLKKNKCVRIEDLRNQFCKWLFEAEYTATGKVFDYGMTTSHALINGKGLEDTHSNGNGSLMRIAPLAFYNISRWEIAEVSAITHAHPISKLACIIFIELLEGLLKGKHLEELLSNKDYPKPFDRLPSLLSLPVESIKSTGYVVHTLEASLWCILHSTNFVEAVLLAVNLGDDTDTTGAVTGALAGVIYGFEAIPKSWIEMLQNKELIDFILSQ